jgi:hypothetical protein
MRDSPLSSSKPLKSPVREAKLPLPMPVGRLLPPPTPPT